MKRINLIAFLLIMLMVGVSAQKKVYVDSLKQAVKNETSKLSDIQRDSITYSKLSPNQLMELKKEQLELEKTRIEKEGKVEMPMSGFQIFLITMLQFLFAGVIIYLSIRDKSEESRRKYDLYTKSIEMGQAIPDHFFDAPKERNSALKKGILWLFIGLGFTIYFLINHNYDGLIVGIVPSFVGIGYLLVHFLDKPKPNSSEKDNE
jgi:large-conductance mechanosensitive channel